MKNSKRKPSKLKILQLTQMHFATAGICPKLVEQPYPINGKIFMGFFILTFDIICGMIFLFYEAKTFTENTRTTFMCSLAVLIFLSLLILMFNAKELFQAINDCEKIVNTGECGNLNIYLFLV